MKTASRIRGWAMKTCNENRLAPLVLFILGTVALYLFILFYARTFAESFPLLSVGLSWVWFFLPGLLLSLTLVHSSHWWERIPIAFVLTIGVATPLTVAAILLRLSMDIYISLHAGSLLVFAVLAFVVNWVKKPPGIPTSTPLEPARIKPDRAATFLLITLIILVVVLAFLALEWPISGDDTTGLPLFADVLNLNKITGTEPFHGSSEPVTPRNELIVATYLEILTNKIAGTPPQEFLVNSRPFFVILAMLSLAALLFEFLKDKRQSLFLLNLWNIYLLATLQVDKTGSDFITRIFQDKFLGWFTIVPIALVFMKWFMLKRDWFTLAGFSIVTLGASLVHPITLIQEMILIGSFGLFHIAITRSKVQFSNLVIVALVLLLCTLIPFVQYLRYTSYMPVDLIGLGDAVEFGRLSSAINRYRLWLLEGEDFILHPAIILQPVILAAYLMLPVILLKMRRNYLVQLTAGTLILLPILLYIPFLAKLVGKVVTPYLLWRLAWPLPLFAVLAIGIVIWQILLKADEWVSRKGYPSTKTGFIYPSLILLTFLFAVPSIRSGVSDYNQRRKDVKTSVCVRASDALTYLSAITHDQPANVLASHNVNICIPGFAYNANVLEYRGYGTVNRLSSDEVEESVRRVDETLYFGNAKLLDERLMETLNRYEIGYILIERDKLELDLQFRHLPDYFQAVYADADFRLYSVQNQTKSSGIIEANTALQMKEFDKAIEIFGQILQVEPANVLAHLGIGLAEEGLGNNKLAILSYQKASRHAPDEPAIHAQMASAYMLMRDFDRAADEYQIAVGLSPKRANLHKALGEIYVLLGQPEDALISFEEFASLNALEGSASYYSILGRSLQSIEIMKEHAISYQEKAISLQPQTRRYNDLARTLTMTDEMDKAVEVLEESIRWDRWSYLPHLELGYIHWSQGDVDRAIGEFETACRLNPANITGYILLGLAIQERHGVDAAISRMEELKHIDNVLPGPYRSHAILMAGSGDYDSAFAILDRSAEIQPKSPAVLSSKGYISLIAGMVDVAYESFEQALFTYPDHISATLGLGMVYNIESNYQMEAGQFLQVAQLVPTASWIHLILADMYKQQGDYPSALDEINWAIKLDSNNPDGYLARAEINKMQSNWSLAIADTLIARDLDPNNSTVLISLGDIYLSQADYAKAENLYQLAAGIDPDSVYPVIKLSNLYWVLGRADEAAALDEKAKILDPDSNLVLIKIANSYTTQGKIEDARAIYNQLIQTDPNVIAAQIGFAQLVEENDSDLSMLFSIYNNLMDSNPGSAEAYLASGVFFVNQGQYDLAEQVFTTSLTYSDVSFANYLALSELHERRGDTDSALSTLETSLKIFPGNANVYYNLASYYYRQGNLSHAEANFIKAVTLDPGLIAAYAALSQLEQIRGDDAGAEEILQTALRKNPGSAEALIALAGFQEAKSKIDQAESNIIKALEINPANINTRQFAGLFYMNQQRYADALEQFDTALTLPGSKLEIYLGLGDLEAARSRNEDAIHWYQKARLEDQSDVDPYIALARTYQSMGNFEEAANSLLKALQIEPANVEVNIALGELSRRAGKVTIARDYFENAIALDNRSVNARTALAELETTQGNWQEAIGILEQTIIIEPTNLLPYTSLAQIYQIMNECSKAEAVLKEGIQKTPAKQNGYLAAASLFEMCDLPENASEYYALAWDKEPASLSAGLKYVEFLQRQNKFEPALTALQLLEKSVGADVKISVELGDIHYLLANWEAAADAYKQALTLDDTCEEGYLGLARTYEKQGDMDAVIALYHTAAGKVYDPIDVHLGLGIALRSQGKFEEARSAFQKTLELEPFNAIGIINMEELNIILGGPGKDILEYVKGAIKSPSSGAFATIAQLYQRKGDWSQAYSWLQKAVNLEPLNSENWLLLGNHYHSLGQLENAIESYTQAYKLNPGSPKILVAAGQVQEEMMLFDDAQISYEAAINSRPGDITGYVALANLQLTLDKPEDALQTIQSGIAKAPGDYRGYEALGNIYTAIESGSLEKAENAYLTGLALLPASPELLVRIGDLHSSLVITAWENLETALDFETWAEAEYKALLQQIGPDGDINSQPRRIQIQIENAIKTYEQAQMEVKAAQIEYDKTAGHFNVASENYKSALAIDSDNVSALLGMGNLQLAHGLTAEGLNTIEKACALNPNSSLAFTHLGSLYEELGWLNEAAAILELINHRDPGNEIAQAALTNVYANMTELSISQAALSVEKGAFKLEGLIEGLRAKEVRQ